MTNEAIRPIRDRILIRTDLGEKMSDGGLHLISRSPTFRGTVVAVGPGYWTKKGAFIPTTLFPGDRVIYGEFTGSSVLINGYPYAILREMEILAREDPFEATADM